MEIIGPQTPLSITLLSKSPQAIVDAWKVGQLVNATTIKSPQNGQATINIGGTLLLAQTQLPIQPGQIMQLKVSSLATLAVLKIIDKGKNGQRSGPVTITLPPHPNLLKQLHLGKLLEAIVTSPSSKGRTSQLTLAGTQVNVQFSSPLPATIRSGQTLKLEVINPGKLPALKILNPSASILSNNITDALANKNAITQALRATLPQQIPLPPLLANLSVLAQKNNTIAPKLPQPLVEIVRNIVEQLPSTKTINSGEGLKQAVTQSGLFLETKLAQSLLPNQPTAIPATPNISIDFKGGLLSLLVSLFTLTKATPGANPPRAANMRAPFLPHLHLQAQPATQPSLTQQMNLQQTLLELLRNVEGGLARLQLSQLISSGTEEDGRRLWALELPVRNGENIDLIQLRIQKEKEGREKKKNALWTVNLAFDLAGLGPIQVRVMLTNGTINTTFWSEKTQTTELINDHLDILHQRFEEVGLTVGVLESHKGQAPEIVTADSSQPDALLDVQA